MTSRKIPESAVENLVSDLEGKANVSLSNLSAAGQAKFDAKADVSLSNLSAAGQAKFDAKANVDLSNLNATGNAKFANPSLSNVNSTGKQTVVGWGMPDYSAGVAKNRNTQYTAEIDGLLFVCFNMHQTPANTNYMTINNVVVHGKRLGGNTGGGYFSVYPLSKNDNWIFSTSSSQGEIMFYPLKGVN